MKNKSFKNYYDEIQVDENLLQQIPIKKHHYYKPILIISCVVLLFVLGIQNKRNKKKSDSKRPLKMFYVTKVSFLNN